jgi:cation-transporting ATPase I
VAHIEIRAGRRPGTEGMLIRLHEELHALKGVRWAEVDGVLGRVVVALEDDDLDLSEIVDVVEAVEEAHGLHEERFGFDREEHPADGVAARRALTGLCADVVGIGASVAGLALRLSPIPVELASIFSFVDSTPRLRRLVEDRLGPSVADLGLGLTNAVAQGLGGGPFGLAVDAVQRLNTFTESRSAGRCFERRSPDIFTPGGLHAPVARQERPRPLPSGPIERYADRAGLASILATGVTFAATLDPRRSAAVALAGMAKPARAGREAFASQLARDLSKRGIVVLDPASLRRLDRVDSVVVEGELLTSGEEIDRMLLSEGADHVDVHRRLAAQFDADKPGRVVKRGGWSVGPLAKLDAAASAGAGRLALQLGDAERYGVEHSGEIVAVFSVRQRLAPGVRDLVSSIRRAGYMFAIAGGDPRLADELHADLLLDSGDGEAAAVRQLQADGCVVALVAEASDEALASADVGIGVRAASGSAPRAADVLCLDGLVDVDFLVAAIAVAHEVSRQSAAISLAGSALGAGLALINPPNLAGGRALAVVNTATLISMANGTRAGFTLGRRPESRLAAPPWHELPAEEVLRRLGSGEEGLSDQMARKRLAPSPQRVGLPMLFGRSVVDELANPLTPVLAGGSALAAATGSTVDAVLVAGVAGAGSLIGGLQRFRAERAVEALASRTAPTARVRRGGRTTTIDADLLVPGDVVLLESGDAVPADCRVIDADGLEVDESSLTGESFPVEKSERAVFAPAVAERTSMLYEGSTVAAGEASAVVVEVGAGTEANAGFAVGDVRAPSGGVERRLRELTAMTIPVAALGGGAVAASALLRGMPLSGTIGPAVSLAVAAIPEGLPVLATAAQIAAARRLATHGIVVRNPRAVEALGRVEVLCVDKTGTLTEGRIELHSVLGDGEARPAGMSSPEHRAIVAAALRASPAAQDGRSLPHMTDEAIIRGARLMGVDPQTAADGWERVDELHFEPSRGYHATLGRIGGTDVVTVKGAPEELLGRCTSRAKGSGSERLNTAGRARLVKEVDELARRGLRVLAVAERRLAAEAGEAVEELDDASVSGLTLLGLVALADPIRGTAAQAVDGVRAAGVDVVMVTGDHPSTAEGIAVELGILNGRRVMTGAQLDLLSEDELDAVLDEVSVFARVTPLDKVRIVAAYQRAGRAVAMTGDGANDAPAIRLADVGIAIGARATPAARDAADVVIADDRIETIVDAIIEGRALWAAVRDAIAILLGGNLGEIIFTAGTAVVTGRSPLNARQLLLVNLLTDVAPALTIAVRQPADRTGADLAAEGPELSLGAPLRRAIALRAATTATGAGLAFVGASLTGRPHRAGTTALAALVGTQLGQTIASSYGDPWTVAAAVASAGVLCVVVQTPGVSQVFGCTPLGPVAWGIAIGSAGTATAGSLVVPALARRLRRS